MALERIAVVFENRLRPETTGTYCLRALQNLVPTDHWLPDEVSTVPSQTYDLIIVVDDGLRYRLPRSARPAALWAIDTHLDLNWTVERAADFDVVFTAQQDAVSQLGNRGVYGTSWLPLACDPGIHARHEVTKQFDVCFVGNLISDERIELIRRIQRHFANTFVEQRYFDEMAQTYSASRTVFNRSVRNDLNMRVFEALACGSLLITNALADNGQHELFEDGKHLATYNGPEELIDKLQYYITHDAVRQRIERQGHQEVLAKHTYFHRMQQLLDVVREQTKSTVASFAAVNVPQRQSSEPVPTHPGNSSSIDDITGVEAQERSPNPDYFQFARPEVAELVPTSARQILEIGCGAGLLGAAIKARQSATIYGVELDPWAVEQARRRLDQVWAGDIEQLQLPFPVHSLDCIICADTLEHLERPDGVLERIRAWLKPDGILVASIPNVRHHSILRSLLDGNWTYEAAGLLDKTHLRFFTRREFEKLFDRAGYDIAEIRQVVLADENRDLWERAGQPGELRAGRLCIGGLTPQAVEEFFVYQYLVSASPSPRSDPGLTSIVVVTHNGIEHTRRCVESVLERTDVPFEFIFVDNASSDGTLEFLRQVPGSKVIENNSNRGFPAAVNQAFHLVSGRQVLLLNNDCVVTTGWLRRLLAALDRDPMIGIVGPCSNSASRQQRVAVDYTDLDCLDGFAWEFGKQHRGEVVDAHPVEGFCMLLRREAIDRIGLFDERFGLGNFDDIDYCTRAVKAGYRVVVAKDCFVHHVGGATFVDANVDRERLMHENLARFRDKWAAADPTWDPHSGTWPSSPQNGNGADRRTQITTAAESAFQLVPALPRCVVLMVTYNRLEYTRLALESVLQLDYPDLDIAIWDNASTDGTVEFLRQRLQHVPHARLLASSRNMGVVHPMNAVWFGAQQAELLAKVDNDTLVPADLLRKLAACHNRSSRLGVISGFHFRSEDEAAATPDKLWSDDGVSILRQPYVGGCAIMVRREALEAIGPIRSSVPHQDKPYLDGGWTPYQQRLTDAGLINGYVWPPIYVEHMEDARSTYCIRTDEHQSYKRAMRGMSLEEFTDALCVWRPN